MLITQNTSLVNNFPAPLSNKDDKTITTIRRAMSELGKLADELLRKPDDYLSHFCILSQLCLEYKSKRLDTNMDIVKEIFNTTLQTMKLLKTKQINRELIKNVVKMCNKGL